MKKTVIILFAFSLFLLCKKKNNPDTIRPEQIIGTRYSRIDQYIFSKPGSWKKNDRVVLVYALEEVKALEEIQAGKKIYYKVSTVTNKEGFAPASLFTDEIIYIIHDGVGGYSSPQLSSSFKGNLIAGTICLVKKTQGEWVLADCLNASIESGKYKDLFSVWFKTQGESFSRDPMLGQTCMLIRLATKSLSKFQEEGNEKDFKFAKEKLKLALDRKDALATKILKIMEENGMAIGEDSANLGFDPVRTQEK